MNISFGKKIHIVSRNIVLHDAVGNFSIGLSDLLEHYGAVTQLYAQGIAPEYKGRVASVSCLMDEVQDKDILVCSYSIFDEYFDKYSNIFCSKKVLYFHNVTPGKFFRPYSEYYADILENSLRQYVSIGKYDVVMANSKFSLEEILSHSRRGVPTLVHPPFFSVDRLSSITPEAILMPNTRHTLLWVGRVTPHKRPEKAIAILGELSKLDLDIALIFVGSGYHDFPQFAAYLDACIDALPEKGKSNLQIIEGISDEQLAYLYRKASLLLCTSAHEGYCVPLAEAASCGLPVAALPQAAILETLNGGGLLLEEHPEFAARQIRNFLLNSDENERAKALPVIAPLPTDRLIRLIME